MAYTYPEDRSGTLASNKIVGELQTITAQNNRNFHFIVPKFAPFFGESFKLFKNINGNQLPLVKDVDFYFAYKYESASLSTGKEVFGGIAFTDLTLDGEISYDYQTVGGKWTLDENQILEIIANEIYNPRGRTWDQVHGKPETFGPTSHVMDYADFLTPKAVGDKYDQIAEAIALLGSRPTNQAPVTLHDLGIPKIGNWGLATVKEATDGESADTLITPLTLKAVLDKTGLTNAGESLKQFNEHILNLDNPHKTNKAQTDLGKVENRAMAPGEKILSGEDDEGLMSLTDVKTFIRLHGCSTRPEEEKVFLPKGALISSRCTSNYDKIGLFADGVGHTYELEMEVKSTDCGYKPPQPDNFPRHGTILQYYCLDYDRWKIVADGYGGSYHSFVMANSLDCGYAGGGTVTKPPEGTLLSAFCDGTVMVQTLANGQGGSYEKRIPGHAECAGNTRPPLRGILVTTRCENQNEIGKYTDGAGGYYEEVVVQNSVKCGYNQVTSTPPVSFPPYGTPQGSDCQGTTYVNLFANGSGGTYSEIVERNSPRCGGSTITTTTTTTQSPQKQMKVTYKSTGGGYLTPNTNTKERHTYTVENGPANSSVTVNLWVKGSNNQQSITWSEALTTNAQGYASGSIEVGVYGKDPNAAFVPDDTYQCWGECNGVKSDIVTRIFAGFGSSPTANMNISFSINPSTVIIGSMVYYSIVVTGGRPNTTYDLAVKLRPRQAGYKEITSYTGSVRTDASGKVTFTITPTMQGTPNGITGPSPIIPDTDYSSYVVIEGANSNTINYTYRTGSTLQLQNSMFA